MNDIEGFVLAGGASSRMRRDKAKLPLGGVAFAERAAIALSSIAREKISIVGGSFGSGIQLNLSNAQQIRTIYDLPILPDVYSSETGERGAIIGLHAALFYARTDWLAVLACDLPFASGALFGRLNDLRQGDFDAAAPIQPDGKPQPLCALYRRAACLPLAEKMLAERDWSVRRLLEQVKFRPVEFAEVSDLPGAEYFFFNINTPADYERALLLPAVKS